MWGTSGHSSKDVGAVDLFCFSVAMTLATTEARTERIANLLSTLSAPTEHRLVAKNIEHGVKKRYSGDVNICQSELLLR